MVGGPWTVPDRRSKSQAPSGRGGPGPDPTIARLPHKVRTLWDGLASPSLTKIANACTIGSVAIAVLLWTGSQLASLATLGLALTIAWAIAAVLVAIGL